MNINAGNDPVHNFLMEAHNICIQAQFIVDSLPNAEIPAVECSTHQLSAIRQIVAGIDDPAFTDNVREELLETVHWRTSSQILRLCWVSRCLGSTPRDQADLDTI
ncbi:hypothetical protein C8R45DRAFT_1112742 [Mycena sanguinolenta]|nr:hypothetical protein C8R45DRAFT_1112742 [Mycena sanguinolenta]